jgi:transposase
MLPQGLGYPFFIIIDQEWRLSMTDSLIVGLDFSRDRIDACFLHPNGKILQNKWSCDNSPSGYQRLSSKSLELSRSCDLKDTVMGGEATGYYWLPFFLEAAKDTQLKKQGSLHLYLLNPAWVKFYKRGICLDHKNDPTDAYYIADRLRAHPPSYEWQADESWLPLRWFTRLRFRLVQQASRIKNQFQAHLFLQYSAYNRIKPFSSTLGSFSSIFALDNALFQEIAQTPIPELAEMISPFCKDPLKSATALHRVREDSFVLSPHLQESLSNILTMQVDVIDYFASQIKMIEAWIANEVSLHHPEVRLLATIPGIGPIFSSGIAAEIGSLDRFLSGEVLDSRSSRYRPKNLRNVENEIAKMAGLWWPENSSGQFSAEESHLSKSGNPYLRYYLIQAAECLRQHIPCFSAYYSKKYDEVPKHKHKRALVLTARKSLGLYIGLLHRKEAFDLRKVK